MGESGGQAADSAAEIKGRRFPIGGKAQRLHILKNRVNLSRTGLEKVVGDPFAAIFLRIGADGAQGIELCEVVPVLL